MSNVIARKLETLRTRGGMKSVDIANLLGTTPETVSRWNKGKASPHSSTQKMLLELDYIVELLAEFYEPDEARIWLYSRHKLLEGQRPADLVQQGRTQEVIDILDQLRDSVYV